MVNFGIKTKVAVSSVIIASGTLAIELGKSLRDPSPSMPVSGATLSQAELIGGAALIGGALMLAFAVGDYIDQKFKERSKNVKPKAKPKRYDFNTE